MDIANVRMGKKKLVCLRAFRLPKDRLMGAITRAADLRISTAVAVRMRVVAANVHRSRCAR